MHITKSKLVITLAAASSIFLAVGINGVLSAEQKRMPPPKAPAQAPLVAVTKAKAVSQSASIVAYGEVKARNNLSLTSQISGQVVYLSPKFLTGKQFQQGELMAQVEAVNYQQALATAQANLADAKLALAQEILASEQAAQEWQQSGLAQQSASDLVLRKPQLAAAKAKYAMSESELAKAKYDLAQTKIVAPFDAVVVSRQIQLGANVQPGTVLAELNDIALFEVALPLSSQQWQLLPDLADTELAIELVDQTHQHRWRARVDRGEAHISGTTRQRALVAAIDEPLAQSTPLYTGEFVKAELTGETFSNLWQLPASALIDSGRVWQVTEQHTLAYLPVTTRFAMNGYVYVESSQPMQTAYIVNRPLSSYLENMKVQMQIEE